MVEVPEATGVITPVLALIVATVGVPDVHVPPLTVEVNVVVLPIHTLCVPPKLPAVSGGQLIAVQLPLPDARHAVEEPVGVTVIATTSLGLKPLTVYGELAPLTGIGSPPLIV